MYQRLDARADHTHNDCFACAILTHGDQDDVLYAKDGKYKLKDVTRLFGADKCPSLAGKPKLFFIQVRWKVGYLLQSLYLKVVYKSRFIIECKRNLIASTYP